MNQLLAAVIAVLVAVTPFLRAYVQAKLGTQKLAAIHQLASVAVNAAERVGAAEASVDGAAKFTVAANFLADASKRVGLKLTGDEINGFVHSALRDMELAGGVVKEQTAPTTAVIPAA